MATEIKVPTLGESVTEATVAKWFKTEGDVVEVDEPILELETDKVTLEVNATAAGTISEISAKEGENVGVGAILGLIGKGADQPTGGKQLTGGAPKVPAKGKKDESAEVVQNDKLSPAVRRLVVENNLDPTKILATGKDGRLTKGDVLIFMKEGTSGSSVASRTAPARVGAVPDARLEDPREERVKMTRLRQRIAERLKEAQNTAAMLTTFNEIDMSNVIGVRKKFQDDFERRHGCRLGLMSFFVKACVVALKELPAVNAEVDGDEIIYKNYYDIGVAVGTEQGLVVPVLRDADGRSFGDVEKGIADLGLRARAGKLGIDELTGGTFTITNGGVYGSLMSTPIINPPQTGILGMHKIDRRPVAVGDSIEIRPMMYVALSYDHRIIDGREAVLFLVRVKECIEDPERILLAV